MVNNNVFWDGAPWRLVDSYRNCNGAPCFRLQRHQVHHKKDCITLSLNCLKSQKTWTVISTDARTSQNVLI